MISGHLTHVVALEHTNDLLRAADRDRLTPRGNRRRRAVPAAPGLRLHRWARTHRPHLSLSAHRLHVG